MSWLRNHFRHFVLPGIHTLARHSHKGGLTAVDIKPRDKQIRPSTKCKFVEAGLLYSLVSSVLKKGDPTREAALGLCRQIGRAKDAEFVYEIDSRGGVRELGKGYDGVEGPDVLHSMLCNSMRRLKRKMRKKGELLLPGRDVWCWEVMARKLTVQSTFDARVSRSVAYNPTALRICIDDWQIRDWSDILFFDTGFSGSIPRAIARAEQLQQINMLLLSSGDPKHQIFRTHTGSRKKALAFEYLAKYFQSGTHRDGQPYQELNDLDEFIKAAMLTIWLWYHISPTKLPSYRDKKIPRPKTKLNYEHGKGSLVVDSGTSTAIYQPMFVSTTTAGTDFVNITTSSANTTGLVGGWSTQSAATLDHLWNAGTAGGVLIDESAPPATLMDELKKEIDQKIICDIMKQQAQLQDVPTKSVAVKKQLKQTKSLLTEMTELGLTPSAYVKKKVDDAHVYHDPSDGTLKKKVVPAKAFEPLNNYVKDPANIPKQVIPIDQMFEPVDSGAKAKIKPYVLNPETFTLHDAASGANVEVAEDVQAILAGKKQPVKEGYGLGEYPGPPVVNAKMLKTLAGMDPNDPGIPQIDVSIEMDSEPSIAGGHKVAFKKTTLTKPDGTKKVFKTPITG